MKTKYLFVLCVLTRVAFSEEKKEKPKAPTEYKKVTALDFEAASVDGEFLKPDGQAVKGDQNLGFDSLMEPRNNFQKELKRSPGAVR